MTATAEQIEPNQADSREFTDVHEKMLNEFLKTDVDLERDLRKTLAQSFRRKKTISQQIEMKNSKNSSRGISQENSPDTMTRKTGTNFIK